MNRRRSSKRSLDDQSSPQAGGNKFAVQIDLTKPGPSMVKDVLQAAIDKMIGVPVALHLVGAKLARRFPGTTIENYPAGAVGEQPGHEAHFVVGNTTFRVSVAPTSAQLQHCAGDLARGLRPYMLVPAAAVVKARAFAEDKNIEDRVAIVPIETFVGQNIDQMGEFNRGKVKVELAALLREYNRRVSEVETDQSIQIIIPADLAGN